MTLSRGRSPGGGDRVADAELQADVMRFVAILALCLVGISTLAERASGPSTARSAAAAPVHPETASEWPGTGETTDGHGQRSREGPGLHTQEDETRPQNRANPGREPGTLPPDDMRGAAPSSGRLPRVSADPQKMEPAPPSSSPVSLPVVDGVGSIASQVDEKTRSADEQSGPKAAAGAGLEASPPSARRGLSLRFESDAALLRMVGRGEAGVFVLAGGEVFELDTRRGVEFRPAPAPARMHVITPETVPALLRAEYDGPAAATWGVTLPSATLDAMRPFLERGDEGVLVIAADGAVRLETDDA